jgi:hypothetical protein
LMTMSRRTAALAGPEPTNADEEWRL